MTNYTGYVSNARIVEGRLEGEVWARANFNDGEHLISSRISSSNHTEVRTANSLYRIISWHTPPNAFTNSEIGTLKQVAKIFKENFK